MHASLCAGLVAITVVGATAVLTNSALPHAAQTNASVSSSGQR
jgi:hypothetical protein